MMNNWTKHLFLLNCNLVLSTPASSQKWLLNMVFKWRSTNKIFEMEFANVMAQWGHVQMCSVCSSYGSALLGWSYLAVQLLVQLTDALSQLCKLLCNDSMVDRLGSICLHIKVLWHKITVALWKNKKHKSLCYKICLILHKSWLLIKRQKLTYSPFIYIFSCCHLFLIRIMWVLGQLQQPLGTLPRQWKT